MVKHKNKRPRVASNKARVKNWVFTLNNPIELLDYDDIEDLKYGIYSEEIGTETFTYHFQGFLQFNKDKRLTQLQRYIPGGHFEPAADPPAAIAYVIKAPGSKHDDGSTLDRTYGLFEYGTYEGGQGKRNDLLEAKLMIDNGANMLQVAKEHFGTYVRYSRGLEKYKLMTTIKRKRTADIKVVVMYGAPGTGKSYLAEQLLPDAFWLEEPSGSTLWWDGYNDEDSVVIDEYNYGWIKWGKLMKYLDHYNCKVEVKNGTLALLATNFCFTSNTPPWRWYKSEKIDFRAFTRRVSLWVYFWKRQHNGEDIRGYDEFESYEEFQFHVQQQETVVVPGQAIGRPYTGQQNVVPYFTSIPKGNQ